MGRAETAALSRADFLELPDRSPAARGGLPTALAGVIRRPSKQMADLLLLDQLGHLAKRLLDLAAGEPTSRSAEVITILLQRRAEQIRLSLWVERHHRPGQPL